jgi:tetratricopeptide (TPR) repeat protein
MHKKLNDKEACDRIRGIISCYCSNADKEEGKAILEQAIAESKSFLNRPNLKADFKQTVLRVLADSLNLLDRHQEAIDSYSQLVKILSESQRSLSREETIKLFDIYGSCLVRYGAICLDRSNQLKEG